MENKKTVAERLNELPFIPTKIRFFAYAYASVGIEKSRAAWGREYGVKTSTIEKWLKRPGVREYIEIVRTQLKTGHLQEIKDRLRAKTGKPENRTTGQHVGG